MQIGYKVDTSNFTREEAVNYIKSKCNKCPLYGEYGSGSCSGADSAKCNEKDNELLKRFSK